MKTINYEIAPDIKFPQDLCEDKSSWQSRFINALLRLFSVKQRTATAAAVQEQVRRLAIRPASYEPSGLGRGVKVTKKVFENWPIYHTAKTEMPDSGDYVVFLHGGGYINEIVRAHWRFVGDLNRQAGVRCIVPIYPLAPGATAKEVVPVMGELLRGILKNAGPVKVTVIGNSAGAGLALAVAQWLRDAGVRQPEKLVLISPGLNAVIDTPDRKEIAMSDPMQDIPGIVEGARLYAGELNLAHPYVSPLNGNLQGLAPMLIFSGTADLLYPDSIELAKNARAAGVSVELCLRKGQPHNYAVLPTPEGREAIAKILRELS